MLKGGESLYTEENFIMEAQMSEKMFDCARHIMLIISAFNGKILKANKEALKSYGYSMDELLNMTIFQLRGLSDDAIVKLQMSEASFEEIIFETKHYRKDGSFFWVEVSSINIGKNEVVLLSRIRDITQIKEREEQLIKSEENFRLLFESMNQGFALHEIILDENENPINYRFLKINKSFEKLIGLTSDQIIGKTVLEILPNTERFWIEEYGQVALKGISKNLRNNSQQLNKYFSVDVYSPKKGQFAVIATDITESELREKQLRENYEELSAVYEELTASQEELKHNYREMELLKEEAESANKAKSQFLSNMSHEIRTPLNGIIGMAQLIEMTSITTEQREYIDMLSQSSQQLLHVINDILDISKIEAGKLQLTNDSFNLKDNLERLIKMYALDGYKKNAAVMIYYQPLLDQEFIGDVLRLNQILVNLLGNAIKFTEVGSVIINVTKVDEYRNKIKLKFSVQDTGIGITIDLKNKLFKLFNQGDSSFTKKYGGTGLGLAISKQLVTMMNGEIWYESEVNKGTVFHFTIELDKQEKEHQIHIENKVVAINVKEDRNIVILVVEDNEINQRLVCKYIELCGYKYICASNGLEALNQYDKEEINLILMDIQMPQMNGFEATQIIREKEKGTLEHIPIIAMTAYAMEGDLKKCITLGMDDYVSKPINLELLKGKLQKFI